MGLVCSQALRMSEVNPAITTPGPLTYARPRRTVTIRTATHIVRKVIVCSIQVRVRSVDRVRRRHWACKVHCSWLDRLRLLDELFQPVEFDYVVAIDVLV